MLAVDPVALALDEDLRVTAVGEDRALERLRAGADLRGVAVDVEDVVRLRLEKDHAAEAEKAETGQGMQRWRHEIGLRDEFVNACRLPCNGLRNLVLLDQRRHRYLESSEVFACQRALRTPLTIADHPQGVIHAGERPEDVIRVEAFRVQRNER